jgi:hypothetical protein
MAVVKRFEVQEGGGGEERRVVNGRPKGNSLALSQGSAMTKRALEGQDQRGPRADRDAT